MALNTISINPKGGRISVEIAFGYAQVGAYTLKLWYSSGKGRVLGEGVNTDTEPDVIDLPNPVRYNVGRIVDCLATIIAPNSSPGDRYRVDMIIRQDGKECGRESDEGPISGKSLSTRLAVELVAEEE